MIRASIIGATGYVGLELTRLLYAHPQVQLVELVSQSFVDKPMSSVYPSLKGVLETNLTDLNVQRLSGNSDVVFTSLPHGASDDVILQLVEAGLKVIDMSGDYRYTHVEVYEKWYKTTHPHPDLLQQSVYGLPELHREAIRKAQLVGNPGCYTTCSILALAPLLAKKLVKPDSLIIDAKSGATGAGRNPSPITHFCELDGNLRAYNVSTHRHTSEIEQELSFIAQQEISVSFTPHLLPIKRGILATCYANVENGVSVSDIEDAFAALYSKEPFVRLHPPGVLPEIKYVVGSNNCHIGFVLDNRVGRLIVVSCIDNLIKGAAGQGVQNMNLLFGCPENSGLDTPAWYL